MFVRCVWVVLKWLIECQTDKWVDGFDIRLIDCFFGCLIETDVLFECSIKKQETSSTLIYPPSPFGSTVSLIIMT